MDASDGFTAWLLELPAKLLNALYDDPWNVQVVFRILPPLAKQYVMRLICISSLPARTMESWVLPLGKAAHHDALRILMKLKILQRTRDDPDSVSLNLDFQAQLKAAVSELRVPWAQADMLDAPFDGKEDISKTAPPTVRKLRKMAAAKWDAVLHHLVGSNLAGSSLSGQMRKLLLDTDLMRVEEEPNQKIAMAPTKGKGKKRAKKGALSTTVERAWSPTKIESAPAGSDSSAPKTASASASVSSSACAPPLPVSGGRRLIITHHRKHKITSAGYEFLLQGTHAQIWRFLRRYFVILEKRDADLPSAIGLIFRLGFCTLGAGYYVRDLSQTQQIMLTQLRDFGLVHIQDVLCRGSASAKSRGNKQSHVARCFFPTPFGIGLLTGSTPVQADLDNRENENGYIGEQGQGGLSSSPATADLGFSVLVETNFRVYAYTTSSLHVYMLKLFANLLYRLPNMVLAVITRASATAAMKCGITASQICRFLSQHAHPHMSAAAEARGDDKTQCLPENVVDQLHLWERERRRVQPHRAGLFEHFRDKKHCLRTVQWAKSEGCLLWCSSKALIVKLSHFDRCKAYIESCVE